MASMRSHVDVIHHSSFPSLLEKLHVFRSFFFSFFFLATLLFCSSPLLFFGLSIFSLWS